MCATMTSTWGSSLPVTAETGLVTKVVLDITELFQHCNRHIFVDNYFNSVSLVEELLRRGTYACGTLHANRYPDPYKTKKGGMKQGIKIKAVEVRQLQKGSFDKRQVAMVSSNCNPSERTTVQRRTKTRPCTKDVEIPAPFHRYNHSMGGVDLNDQLRSYYTSGRSGKWWRFIFWYILDVSICNAFIIEGLSSHAPSARSRRTHLQFRLELAKQLMVLWKKSIPVKRERHPLTMPCLSQTYHVITR